MQVYFTGPIPDNEYENKTLLAQGKLERYHPTREEFGSPGEPDDTYWNQATSVGGPDQQRAVAQITVPDLEGRAWRLGLEFFAASDSPLPDVYVDIPGKDNPLVPGGPVGMLAVNDDGTLGINMYDAKYDDNGGDHFADGTKNHGRGPEQKAHRIMQLGGGTEVGDFKIAVAGPSTNYSDWNWSKESGYPHPVGDYYIDYVKLYTDPSGGESGVAKFGKAFYNYELYLLYDGPPVAGPPEPCPPPPPWPYVTPYINATPGPYGVMRGDPRP